MIPRHPIATRRNLLFAGYGLTVLLLVLAVQMAPADLPERIFTNLQFPSRVNGEGYQATFIYRGNSQRTGGEAVPIRLPLQSAWQSEQINRGIHGASKGSPAVDESGVYVGSDAGWFYAFDHAGKLRWRFLVGQQKQGIHGTPLLDEKRVYIGAYNGRIYALEKESGRLVWATRVADAMGSSPTMIDGDIIATAETEGKRDGFMLRIDARSGEVLWKSEAIQEQTHSSPTLSLDGNRGFFGNNRGTFQAIDLQSGAKVWETVLGKQMKSTAALRDGTLYFTNWDGRFWALDESTGRVLWTLPLEGMSQSSVLLVGDMAVVSSHRPGFLYGVDVKTHRLRWKRKSAHDHLVASAIAVQLPGRKKASALTFCDPDRMCVLDPETGRDLYSFAVPGEVTGVPAVWGNRIYLSLDRGPLVAYEWKL